MCLVWGGSSSFHHHHQLIRNGAESRRPLQVVSTLRQAEPRRTARAVTRRWLRAGQGRRRILQCEYMLGFRVTWLKCQFIYCSVFEWHSGNVLVSVNEVALCRACLILVCALLTALSIPYSQTTWNSVPGFVCMYVCIYVRTVIQNASSPSFLIRLSWFFNTMVPYLGKIILLHGFLIRALWRH